MVTNPALLEHGGKTALRVPLARALGGARRTPRDPPSLPVRLEGACARRAARPGHGSFSDAVGNPLSPASLDPVSFHHNTAISYHFEPIHHKMNPAEGMGKYGLEITQRGRT